MFKKVFICYAKEDIKFAEELYKFLKDYNFDPWLDKKKLRIGAAWDYEIQKALKESSFIILLLSNISIKKRGFVQKEYKLALKQAELKLEDDIYILPILSDNCTPPLSLQKYQWEEYKNETIFEKVLESLNFQREKYLSDIPIEEIKLNEFKEISIDLNIKSNNKIDYLCKIPFFRKNNFFDASFINTFIQHSVLKIISNYRNMNFKKMIDNAYIDINYNIKILNKEMLSMSITENSFLGGAHPNTNIKTLNFLFNPERFVQIQDLFNIGNFQDFLKENIMKYFDKNEYKETLLDYIKYINEFNLDFVMDNKKIQLIFVNQLPRVIMSLGFLEIPISKLKKVKM